MAAEHDDGALTPCAGCGQVREVLRPFGTDEAETSRLAAALRTLSGSYDPAARATVSR